MSFVSALFISLFTRTNIKGLTPYAKFLNPDAMGPQGKPYKAGETYDRTVYFKFDAK